MNFNILSINIKKEKSYVREGEPKKEHDKIYIWPKGETIYENLINRRNRPYNVYKKELIPVLMEKLKEENPEVYERVKNLKWGWSKNCGCSMCPCSPGFIGDKRNIGYDVLDIHVEITMD